MRTKLITYLTLLLLLITSASANFNAYGKTQILANTCTQTQTQLTIKNTENIPQTITLSTKGKIADYARFTTITAQLQPQETKKITVYYDIPCSLEPKTYQLDIYFTGYDIEKQLTQEIIVQKLDSLDLRTKEAEKTTKPGQKTEYTLTLKNPTKLIEKYELSIDETNEDLEIEITPEKTTLKPKEQTQIKITAQPKDNTINGEYTITIRAKTQKTLQEKILPLKLTIENTNIPQIAQGIKTIKTNYEKSAAKLKIKNTGEQTTEYKLTVQGPEWITIEPAAITIQPEEEKEIQLILAPAKETKKGNYEITLKATTQETEYTKKLTIKLKPKTFIEKHPTLSVILAILLAGIITITAGLIHYSKKPSFKRKIKQIKKKIKEKKKKQEKKRKEKEKKKAAEQKKREQEQKKREQELKKKKEKQEQEKRKQKEKEEKERERTQKKIEKEFKKTHHIIAKEHTIKGAKEKTNTPIIILILAMLAVIIASLKILIKNWDYTLLGLIVLATIYLVNKIRKTKTRTKHWKIIRTGKTTKLWKKGITAITPRIRKPIENLKLTVKKTKPIIPPSSNTYQTFEIKTNVKELQEYKITIKTSKKWINTVEEVKLAKLHGHRWQKTNITKTGEDKKHIYYTATTEQGTYAIYGKPLQKTIIIKQTTKPKTAKTTQKTEKTIKKEPTKKIKKIKPKKPRKPVNKTPILITGIILFTILTIISAITMPQEEPPTKGIPTQILSPGKTHILDLNPYFQDPDAEGTLEFTATQTKNIDIK